MKFKRNTAESLRDFEKRTFSGRDVLMILEYSSIGVGAGAAMHVVQELERQHKEYPKLYRGFDRPEQTEGEHVDRVAHDGFGMNKRLIERLPPDSPKIGAQERSGWATYVYVSDPHTMAECPWSQQTEVDDRESRLTAAEQENQSLEESLKEQVKYGNKLAEEKHAAEQRTDDEHDIAHKLGVAIEQRGKELEAAKEHAYQVEVKWAVAQADKDRLQRENERLKGALILKNEG